MTLSSTLWLGHLSMKQLGLQRLLQWTLANETNLVPPFGSKFQCICMLQHTLQARLLIALGASLATTGRTSWGTSRQAGPCQECLTKDLTKDRQTYLQLEASQ